MAHKFIKDWDEFWKFYITNVENEIGKVESKTWPPNYISRKLKLISNDDVHFLVNPIIRKYGQVPDSVVLEYNPNMDTFYSYYNSKEDEYRIGYPTFTKWMIYWEPAVKAAFRHEMGHILRGDCIDPLGTGQIHNANVCMDIRINFNIPDKALEQLYDCLYYKTNRRLGYDDLLIPATQFPKINLDYNPENPVIPGWRTIAEYYNRADKQQTQEPKPPEIPEFEVGDLVIVNSKTSENNGKPGKVVEIDEDGEYVVEAISEEEALERLEMLEKAQDIANSIFQKLYDDGGMIEEEGDVLGSFNGEELIPLQPRQEPQGGDGAGQEGEGEGQDEGQEGGESGESGEDEGQDEGEPGEDEGQEGGEDGKDGKDGKDDVSAMGGMYFCQDMPISTWS